MRSLLFLLGAVSLWGQQAAPSNGAAADPVVLTIGSEKITKSVFQEIIASLPAQQQAQPHTPEARESLAEPGAGTKAMAPETRARKLPPSSAAEANMALQSH